MSQYLAFLAVGLAALAVPGPDTLLVLRTAITEGRRAALCAAAGSAAGNLAWGTASVAGVAAILATSPHAFTALKLAGALYLAYLGATALRAAYRGDGLEANGDASTGGRAFRKGLLTDLLNVKVGLFWTALVPQFLTTTTSAVAMVLSWAILVLAWLALYATLAAKLRATLTKTNVARTLNATTGGAFVALAVKLARA
jgi:threonine/homoserine/homoserine lactone efflux protein